MKQKSWKVKVFLNGKQLDSACYRTKSPTVAAKLALDLLGFGSKGLQLKGTTHTQLADDDMLVATTISCPHGGHKRGEE